MKLAKREVTAVEYPHPDRAARVYRHWMAGFDVDSIADFFGLTKDAVMKDIQFVQSTKAARTVIGEYNDRTRLQIQRAEALQYQAQLSSLLKTDINEFLTAGINPTAPLKEYREAVGMHEKPGGLAVNVQTNVVTGGGAGVTSSEDVLRRVLARMAEEPAAGPTSEPPVIDAEVVLDDVDPPDER